MSLTISILVVIGAIILFLLLTFSKKVRELIPNKVLVILFFVAIPAVYVEFLLSGYKFKPMDLFNILFGMGTLVFGYHQVLINQRLEDNEKNRGEREHQGQLVLDYYPSLIEEFSTLDTVYEQLLNGTYSGSISSSFEVLLEMDKDGTLNIIENIDKDLALPLETIINDVIPSLEKSDDKLRGTRIDAMWRTALSEIFSVAEVRRITKRKFVYNVSSSIHWDLWRKDNLAAEKKLMVIVNSFNEVLPGAISGDQAHEIYKKFFEIATKEFEPIRDELIKKGTQLQAIVLEDILPPMYLRMSTIGQYTRPS